MKRTTIILLAAALGSVAQQPTQPSHEDDLLRWMNAIAQKQLQTREGAVAAVRTVADAERRKESVRRRILDALGGLPDYSGPLNARVTGRIQADGYVIENVLYESLPGYYVTGNVYRPGRPGRYPAVLLQAGHTQEGKAEPQLLAANLALKGFVVLAFDPLGQGEREQTSDPQLQAPAAGWSVPEHIQQGAQADLAGEGLARYFIWDAKRSIDYLVSRPDVDAQRLGAAGCSGGGALTTFIGALDARLRAVIPACYPVSFRVLFTGEVPHSEMILPQEIFRGLDTADFIELSAPTPWLIQATAQDYFTPAGAKIVYEEALRWYRLYGAEDKVAFFVGPGSHGTPLVSREAVYRWLIRWLNNGRGDFHEQPVKLYPNYELLVTKTGHVEDEPGSRTFNQLILDSYRSRRKPGSAADLADELRRLEIPTSGSAPAFRTVESSQREGFRTEHIQFESETGIEIDARLYLPSSSGKKPAVVLVAGQLSDFLAERLAKTGSVILKMEPRRSQSPDTRRPYVGDWLDNTRADMIGISLAAKRAHDILRGVDLLCARADVDVTSIRAAAQGVKGIWLLLATAADPRLRKIWLDKTPYSLASALHNGLNTDLPDAVIRGFVLRWDLEDLTKLMGARPVLWTDPTNWMSRVVPLGPQYRYRWVLGDIVENSEKQNLDFARELMR
jgi:cephalosporin-C deacetylase-like acetyl esterase